MYFYIDESGHTGTNLFDENQSCLYYGVLAAEEDINIVAKSDIEKAHKVLDVEELHGSELGMGGLVKIAEQWQRIQFEHKLKFDIYRVYKPDHAIICFYDQVFDQGINPAMSWTGYWSPLRFILLLKIAYLFDEQLAIMAWKARINTNDKAAEEDVKTICRNLLDRIDMLPDERSKQLLGDSLKWAIRNTSELDYNCKSKKEVLNVTPNIIGFQFVMQSIATKIADPEGANKIVVDRQSEFNKAQKRLAEIYSNSNHINLVTGLGMPRFDLRNMPRTPIEVPSEEGNIGLELVDIYLWLFKRIYERKNVPLELMPIVEYQMINGRTDEISLRGLEKKWSQFFLSLPEPTGKRLATAKEMLRIDEERRKKAIDWD